MRTFDVNNMSPLSENVLELIMSLLGLHPAEIIGTVGPNEFQG